MSSLSAKLILTGALVVAAAGLASSAWALDDKPTQIKPTELKPEDVPAAVREAQAKLDAERKAAAEAAAAAQKAADEAKAAGAAAGAAPMELKTLNIEPAKPAARPVPALPIVESKTLESGMLIEDMKIGDGAVVPVGGAVVAYYHGTLKADGKMFDSAFERGTPAAFPLSGVIKGWQEGVPGMKVGGIRKLTIPAALAYGDGGRPPVIPPNSDLVFVIEVVDALVTEDVKVGEGEAAGDMCVAVASLTFKNASGEVVAQTKPNEPFIVIPGDMQGLNTAMSGMKVGGKRTIRVPKDFAQGGIVQGASSLNVPADQALIVEAELLQVRNLNMGR